LFLARVSRGRTIREFLLGAVLVPCVVCMAWFAFMGGTAIQTELSGRAGGAIMNSAGTAQLFAAIDVLMPEQLVWYISLFTCVLVLMLLITTLSAGILAINTIAAAGDSGRKKIFHVFSWSAAVTTAIGGLLVAGGTSAIRDAMVIGALPFLVVMVLITISIFSELFRVGGTKRRS
jgi:choline/glycine/proline betaine transport protein